MKRTLAILITLTAVGCKAQNNESVDQNAIKYQKAYEYIMATDTVEQLKQPIRVSDTLAPIQIAYFVDELKGDDTDEVKLLDSLNRLDFARNHDGIYSSVLASTIDSDTSSTLTLYFSRIYGNRLLAELVDNRGLTQASYKRVTSFNRSLVFLFEFDESNDIAEVYRKEMQYN